jgi:hypothetical protein
MAINLVIRATNAIGIFDSQSVPTDLPPTVDPDIDQNFLVGAVVNINLDDLFEDPEGNLLTYTITGSLPSGLIQSGIRGESITGTILSAGITSIQISADDAATTTDQEADWTARSRASGVFYANNLSEKRLTSNGTFQQTPYADSAALRAASTTSTAHLANVREVLLNTDPNRALSGGKSLEIKTFGTNTAASGGGWQQSYKDTNASVNSFYFQFSVYLQKDALAWRLPNTNGQMKILNLEQYGGGQVVVSAANNFGFPFLLLNGTGLMERFLASTPYRVTSGDWFYQTAIDSGAAAGTTRQTYLRKYGPGREISNTLYDYGYISDNATNNLLYNRDFDWPDSDALQSGAVPYNMDGWTTIEVYINNGAFSGAVETSDRCKMWVAAHGDAPVLVCDLDALPNDDPPGLGTAVGSYNKFEALWYDTAFEGSTEDVGYRPTQQRWYAEFIGSTNPIDFPGGHALPGV